MLCSASLKSPYIIIHIQELAQIVGIQSLGATDTQLAEIANLFWYTVETGFVKQNGKNVSYGGSPAASILDLEKCQENKANFKPLEVFTDCSILFSRKFPQESYRVTPSFREAIQDVKNYIKTITKPIEIIYNPETNEVEYNRNWKACTECGIKEDKV